MPSGYPQWVNYESENNIYLQQIYQAIGRRVLNKWDTDAEFDDFGIQGRDFNFIPNPGSTVAIYTANCYYTSLKIEGADSSKYIYSLEFDITNISEIKVLARTKGSSRSSAKMEIVRVSDGEALVTVLDGDNLQKQIFTVDVSAITGTVKYKITLYCGASSHYGAMYIYSIAHDGITQDVGGVNIEGDTVRLNELEKSLAYLSPAFAPTDLGEWDMFLSSQAVNEGNITYDILRSSDKTVLLSNVRNADMIGYYIPASERSIQVRANISRPDVTKISPIIYNIGLIYLG